MPQNLLHKYKYIILSILLSVASVYLFVYYSPWGAKSYFQLHDEIELLTSEVDDLQRQNQEMSNEIAKLKEDTDYIEEVARKQFGLLKKNEVVFEFRKTKKKNGK